MTGETRGGGIVKFLAALRAAGVPVVVGPREHVSGHRRGYVADPDGNWVVLVSDAAA
jgi:catechol 2,3-dioxygenase-like lactoylglutathione lyase family enzyme